MKNNKTTLGLKLILFLLILFYNNLFLVIGGKSSSNGAVHKKLGHSKYIFDS